MAILESRTKTGLEWVKEALALFKTAPRKWLLLSLVYVTIFLMLPSVKGLQLLGLIVVLMWPTFLVVAVSLYRNADMGKQQTLVDMLQQLKPKLSQLMILGAIGLIYGVLMSFLLGGDIESLLKLTTKTGEVTESQAKIAMQNMLPLLLKLSLLLIPFFMATWFSPMLIAFNNYSVLKAIKSSIAGCIQYMVAMLAAWLAITAGIIAIMLVLGIVAGLIGGIVPALGKMLSSLLVFGSLLLATALMLAFQYVSYRDVFKAA